MVQQLFNEVEHLKAEVKRLRGKLDSIAIGNQVILNPGAGSGNNPVPPAASGALIYGTAGAQWGRRAIGAEGEVLQVQSGFPVWDAAPAGTPSATVEDETILGISPAAGASSDYSRGDHTHGSPSLADYGPLFTLTPPVDANYAWVNQGGASVTVITQGIYLLAPATAGTNLRIRKKSKTAPYTITACFLPLLPGLNFTNAGLIFRASGAGTLHAFGITHDATTATVGGWIINSTKYNSATSFNAHYKTQVLGSLGLGGSLWLRIADNNTNRICSYSADGQNWIQFHSIGRTDFLTADEAGFYVNADQNTADAAVTLISWEET